MNQGALHFDALLTVNNFDRGIDRIKNGIKEVSGVAQKETQVMDGYFRNLGTAIGGYFTAQSLFSFTKELINVRGEFQKTEIAFSTMLGSSDKAKKLMEQMVDLAAKTPFSLQDVSSGAKQLLAFQVPAKDIVDTLTRLGNIAAGLNVPLERINLIYGQVKAKNKLMGQELLQFTEAGIPMLTELALKFGKSESEISDMVSAGKIGFKDVQDVLFKMTNEGGMFFELMEKQSASLSGKVANLGDAWDQMLNKIGQSNEGFLYGSIEQLTMLVERYDAVINAVQTLIVSYGAYKAAIIVTAAAQSMANKTLATEIGLLSFSERMKLGRALITQKQTAATLAEAQAEKVSLSTKYATLQAEISSLAVKKQKAVALATERAQALANARIQLSTAQAELASIRTTGTARQINIATRNVEKAQNTVIAAQESAEIARKAALTTASKFYNTQKELEITATALNSATKNVETASEVANTAAKTANTIATQRLTMAQVANTIAMTAAARAAAFLNATLFANPYALATALIAALAFAVYKYSTALTVAEESQNRMNEDAKTQIATITEQESKIKALTKVIEDQTASEDKKASAIKQIHSLTNGRLDQLDSEAVKTGKATEMIKEYIAMLKLEAEAKRYVNELGRLDSDIEDLKNNKGKFGFGDLWDDFTDFDSDFHWSLKKRKEERVNRIVKEKEDEKKLLQEKLDALAKKGINISETEINEGVKPSGPNKGTQRWYEEEIKRLQEANKDLVPQSKKWIQNMSLIEKYQDLLSNKTKKDNRQLAEVLPEGSIKELQRRAQLYSDAIDVAVNGQVKLRKLDKYGNDKDKSGNPYLTGEVISTEEAYNRISEINDKIESLRYKTFQERISEAERQWNNYYKMVEFYGKASADAQYKDLLKGSQNYLEHLEKELETLEKRKNDGGILSNQEKANIIFLRKEIDNLNGTETPLENFKRGIDDAIKTIPSLIEQLKFLEDQQDKAFQKEGNSAPFLEQKKYLEEQKRNVLQQQQELYNTFLNEQQTFEQKKNVITEKYELIRKKIGENNSFTQPERLRLLDASYKNEQKEISDLTLELFQKTDLWIKAFGDLSNIGPKTLLKLKKGLLDYLEANKNLNATEIKTIQDQIISIDETLSSRNPFLALSLAIDKYKQKRKELNDVEKQSGKNSDKYLLKLEETNQTFNEIIETTGAAASTMIGFVSGVTDAFGGMSEELQSTLKDVQQLVDGIVNVIAGYFSGNYGQMLSGIVQIISAMVKLLNGDKKREREIKQWQRAVDDLKSSYEELQKVIEKTAGEESLSMQRELIANLKEQQRILVQMRSKESEKKKSDQDKIATYNQQIKDINSQISDLVDNFKNSITTTDFKDLSQRIADALIEAFGKGEDAAKAFDKVVEDVMRNAVANALRIKILEPAVQQMVDKLYSSMGFGNASNAEAEAKIKQLQNEVDNIDQQITTANFQTKPILQAAKQKLLQQINDLKSQIAQSNISGSFDGLTPEEREKIKALGETAMQQYMDALKQYEDLFGSASQNAQGLKGDIKGITEKTAGALEAQFNAVRINIVEILKIHQINQNIFRSQLQVQGQIEVNTRPLKDIYKEIKELNSKVKNQLAGIP
ncbi:tape measure protein [Chryseobacterium defluvii]|uniref:Tape measure domain-containing protein n=1 Tax=Chryseobacterium defluvii TaxID=160396 RepID=A0A495SLY8_9FLAO|nr:tape measure protein [Chryseobacterium defluvii]RKT01106.1 tape measure domain-containing protein [Chryseobacterium defluvii]